MLADGLATVEEVPAYPWMDAPRGPDGHHRVRRVAPANQDGLTLVLANTVVDGEPFGLDIGVTHRGMPTVFVDAVPDCGCDACDSGAADLLATLDGCVLNVARGGVVHARAGRARVTQTLNGWQSTGDDDRKFAWLEAALPVADEVERWMGAPWQ